MIPLLLGGLALLGVGAHVVANSDNEKAQRLIREAQEMYDAAKQELEEEQENTNAALLVLGNKKKQMLDGPIALFLQSYQRTEKMFRWQETTGENELLDFNGETAPELRQLTNIYSSSVSAGASGAAAGTIIALAASGGLSVVAGGFAAAGSALVAGEIGAAAGLATSAVSLGAALTPISAVLAPIALFTGISASINASDNLSKAEESYEEAVLACEKMATARTLCRTIAKRANMYDKLLTDLDSMYSGCVVLLDKVTKKMAWKKSKIPSYQFSEEELKLLATAHALTGAVKAVIATPLLTKEGNLSDDFDIVYDGTRQRMPQFSQDIEEVGSYNYRTSLFYQMIDRLYYTVASWFVH